MDRNNRPFVRWQATTISHFGQVNNLILGLATASLGFVVYALLRAPLQNGWPTTVAIGAAIAYLVSIGTAVACAVTRLINLRKTTTVVRRREKGSTEDELEPEREKAEILGTWSWGLLWIELGSFALGSVALMVSVAATIP